MKQNINPCPKWDIKSCPFCNGKGMLLHEERGTVTQSFVECVICHSSTRRFQISTDHSSDQKAVDAWNERADEYGEPKEV